MRCRLSSAVVFSVLFFLLGSCCVSHAQPPYRAGWQDIRRAGVTSYVHDKDYDTTGLVVLEHLQYFSSDPVNLVTNGYAGFGFGNEHVYAGIFGLKEYLLITLGESRFKWKWEPKIEHATQQIDRENFKGTFPFFVVARMDAHAELANFQGSAADPTMFVSIDSHLPHPSLPSLDLYGPGTFQFNTWDIIEPEGRDINRYFGLTPTVMHHMVGIDEGYPTNTGDLWDRRLAESVHPITLDMPPNATTVGAFNGYGKVFGIPVKGDMYNKFMFDGILDGDTGTDTLRLPIATHIPRLPIGNNQTPGLLSTLTSKVDWTLTNGELLAGLQPFTKETSTELITPKTIDVSGLVVKASLSKNPHFGNFKIQLMVDTGGGAGAGEWVGSQHSKFQAFFKPDAYTHPDAITTSTPNWWYYYNQVYPVEEFALYSGEEPSRMEYATGIVWIADDAPRSKVFPVFKHDAFGYVRCVGVVTVWGLLAYIFTANHEREHWRDAFVGDETGTFLLPPEYNEGTGEFIDEDEDGLRDSWEVVHHLNPSAYDSCNLGVYLPTPLAVPDNEIPAHVAGLKALIDAVGNENKTWENDWAGLWSMGTTSGANWGYPFPSLGPAFGSPSFATPFWGEANVNTYTYWPLPQNAPPGYMQSPNFLGARHPWYFQHFEWNGLELRYSVPYQPDLRQFIKEVNGL